MPKFLANRAELSAGQTVLVHVKSKSMGKVRKEKLNGRDVIIVPSATMPDDVVMNDITYPAAEIEKSFASLERAPAPLGHPAINGKFVSARDPEGINIGWVGAWNANVRREKGKDGKHRVLVDKIIDVDRANESEGGRRVLEAIEKGEPIHTSTGLLTNLEAASGDVAYKFTARNIEFDHDAILLDEEGAATPEMGVGMLVNAKGEHEEIQAINSSLSKEAEHGLDRAIEHLAHALERRECASWIEQFKSAIMKLIPGSERETSVNQKEDDMSGPTKEQFDALSAEVKTLSDGFSKIGDTIGAAVANAVKPLVDAQAELAANQKAKDEAELTELQAKIVKANLLDEDAAKELTLNAARALAKKAEPGKAAALNGAFKPSGSKSGFKLPTAENGA